MSRAKTTFVAAACVVALNFGLLSIPEVSHARESGYRPTLLNCKNADGITVAHGADCADSDSGYCISNPCPDIDL